MSRFLFRIALLVFVLLPGIATAQERVRIRCGDSTLYWTNSGGRLVLQGSQTPASEWIYRQQGDGTLTLEEPTSGQYLLVQSGQIVVGRPDNRGNHGWRRVYPPALGGAFMLENINSRLLLTNQRGGRGPSLADSCSFEPVVVASAEPPPAPETFMRIRSAADPTAYVNLQFSVPATATSMDWPSAQWRVREAESGRLVLQNRANNLYLTGGPSVSSTNSFDPRQGPTTDQLWVLEPHPDGRFYFLRAGNRSYLQLGEATKEDAHSGRRSLRFSARNPNDVNLFWTLEPADRPPAATVPADLGVLTAPDVCGAYRYEPYSNPWHEGQITQLNASTLLWTNQAGVSWKLLVPANSERIEVLNKEPGSLYWNAPGGQNFQIVRDARGRVTGFRFQNEMYLRK